MKKYIFGFIVAIGLMGTGCTQFEDYTPADMGNGPAVEVIMTIPENTLGTFTVDITPAEGTVYYSYLYTTDSIKNVKASLLLQQKYEGSELLLASETPSVNLEERGKDLQKRYYVYAVAADERGVCGNVAAVSLFLPDTEVPRLVNLPEGNMYTAIHVGRTIELEYNEPVFRGEGALTYSVTGIDGDGMPTDTYADGTVEDIVINDKKVTVSLPENVIHKDEDSYIFLDFAEGVFVDVAGNPSSALKGGVADDGSGILAPWWMYTPDTEAPYLVNIPENYEYKSYNKGYATVIEFNELVVRGTGAITYSIAGETALPPYYAMGTVHDVKIEGTQVTITLDEDIQFDEKEYSYVFLDFEAGAFVDESGNLSEAMKGGVDESTYEIHAPWWEYDPNSSTPDPGTGINIEIGEDGFGSYIYYYTSIMDGQDYQENTYFADAAYFGINTCQYAVLYMGAYLNEELAGAGEWGYLPANVSDNVFYLQNMGIVGEGTNPNDGKTYYVSVIALVADDSGEPTEVYQEAAVPFIAYPEDPRILTVGDERILLSYCWIDMATYQTIDFIDVMYGGVFIPESMLTQTQALKGFKSATVESLKAKRAKKFVQFEIKNKVEIPYLRGSFLKK